ncbi:MAG: zinc metallopeptidase, partial [Desulfobacterales bacterium]
MNSQKRIIGVVPVGDVPELAPKVIAAHILGYLKLPADVLTSVKLPTVAFDRLHQQYDAAKILSYFESAHYDNYDKVIDVFNVDLFIPTFAYVFGEAKQGG